LLTLIYFRIDIKTTIGRKTTKTLKITENHARTVKLYSSDHNILFCPKEYDKSTIIQANVEAELKYCIYSKKEQNEEIVLTCVDINNKQILQSWLVRVFTEKPLITKFIKLDCKTNRVNYVKYEFENEFNKSLVYKFESMYPISLKVKTISLIIFSFWKII